MTTYVDRIREGDTHIHVEETANNGTITVSTNDNGTASEKLRVDSSGKLLARTTASIPVGTWADPIIQVKQANSATEAGLSILAEGNSGTTYARLLLSRSKASGAVVANGQFLGIVQYGGRDSAGNLVPAAWLRCSVDGNPGTNDMPGRLEFCTTNDGGSLPTQKMVLNSAGQLGLGTSSPDAKLDVANLGNANTGDVSLAKFTNTVSGTERGIELLVPDNQELGIGFQASNTTSPFVYKNSAGTERFRVADAGQIGIGGANYGTSGQVLTSTGSTSAPSWQDAAGGGATGGSSDKVFFENATVVTTSYTVGTTFGNTNACNAMTAGPITVNSGVVITVNAGSSWTVI